MTFVRRRIDLQFQLGKGDFGDDGFDTVDLADFRVSANVVKHGISYMEAELRIWGMSLDLMQKLTVVNKLGMQEYRNNTVTISAGDDSAGVAVIFKGNVWEAWVDARNPPDVFFHVLAYSSVFAASTIIPPTSYKGTVDAATLLAGIATQLGYGFENSGVEATLKDVYYPGDAGSQIDHYCRDIGCNYELNDAKRLLSVWPAGGTRDELIVRLAPDTGMIGYPAFTQSGIQLQTVFNPNIEFGRAIMVESQFTPANGQWVPISIGHQLDSSVPGGQWMSALECGYIGHYA